MSEQFRNDANLNSAHQREKMEVAMFSSPGRRTNLPLLFGTFDLAL